MNKWEAITLDELNKKIQEGINRMTETQLEVWSRISVQPVKWEKEELGKQGGGFWVVAIQSKKIIWYNDIEEGFNISTFLKHGEIEEYGAEQDELQWTIEKIKTMP